MSLRGGCWLALLFSGCVTVYQPQAGLQRPRALDVAADNFPSLRLKLLCLPGEYSDSREAAALCDNLETLFSQQGADVRKEVAGQGESESAPPWPSPFYVMELRSASIHERNAFISWFLSVASGTLIPAETDATFAVEVLVRDDEGNLLARDHLRGRFIRYFGLGYWALNGVVNLLFRSPEERIGTAVSKRDFSADLHGQLSQLLLRSKLRHAVLHGFDEPPRRAP